MCDDVCVYVCVYVCVANVVCACVCVGLPLHGHLRVWSGILLQLWPLLPQHLPRCEDRYWLLSFTHVQRSS